MMRPVKPRPAASSPPPPDRRPVARTRLGGGRHVLLHRHPRPLRRRCPHQRPEARGRYEHAEHLTGPPRTFVFGVPRSTGGEVLAKWQVSVHVASSGAFSGSEKGEGTATAHTVFGNGSLRSSLRSTAASGNDVTIGPEATVCSAAGTPPGGPGPRRGRVPGRASSDHRLGRFRQDRGGLAAGGVAAGRRRGARRDRGVHVDGAGPVAIFSPIRGRPALWSRLWSSRRGR
jgi:hypothetical protein